MNIILTDSENRSIQELRSAEDTEFLLEASVLAHQLPLRVRKLLNEFRLVEPPTAIRRIRGYPINDLEIGPTPLHWKERQRHCLPVREEILLVLLGSLLETSSL